ncbi:hypothetical protein JHD49_06635 [Sulfurimonas sp. SAG-AH-194-C21]|nr:hypothetical protein [Sulfurimonas sp. SAG-AH-194-C21]MDF1883610.1 hypothetical protein [Sulfurimonas sp. SAG-AH-194-C21]
MVLNRLELYFEEAHKHIDLINESIAVLPSPIKVYDDLSQLQRFALNALIFRFSKLQDLIGSKIFRNYLDFSGFNLSDSTFFDILREIEKESIVDIDSWDELRELRNKIAHDYPEEVDEMLESINLFLIKSGDLMDILIKLEKKFYEIKNARNRAD